MYDRPVKVRFALSPTASHVVTGTAQRMVPVSFGTCFGWLHAPAHNAHSGIVLCAALGQEARHVHRQWRILADRLAGEGHAVLRFDYPDTGDSWSEPGADTLDSWVESVGRAVAFLRDSGACDITLLGLRLGATLAALATARFGGGHKSNEQVGQRARVDRLIMLAPVVAGRLYIREMRVLSRLAGRPGADAPASDTDGIEASGLRFDAATMRAISQIDLRRDLCPCPAPIMLLDPGDVNDCSSLVGELRQGSDDVSVAAFDDFAALISNAHTNVFPERSFAQIAAWLRETASLPTLRDLTSMGVVAGESAASELVLHPPGVRERPCFFGAEQRLFGVLCEPMGAPLRGHDLAVVHCNNGSNPHHGHGRFAVTSGRAMAEAGIATFRMDFAGLGDSAGGPNEERPHLFDAPRDAEISQALDLLEQHGYRRFVLTGICAGAYHAFHGALADPRVVGIYAVNLPKFRWPAGDDPDQVIAQSMHATSYYLGGMCRLETWRRLLCNDINVSRVASMLMQRMLRRIAAGVMIPIALRLGSPSGTGFPRWAMAALSRRGVRVHLLFGHDDPGVEDLVRCFGTKGRKLSRLAGCSIEIPNDVDHAISYTGVRQAVHARLLAFTQSVIQPGESVL